MHTNTNEMAVEVGRYTDTTTHERAYWPLDGHGSVIGGNGAGGTVALSAIASQAAAAGVTVWVGGTVPNARVLPDRVVEKNATGAAEVYRMLATAQIPAPRRRLLIVLDDADELLNNRAVAENVELITRMGRNANVSVVARVHGATLPNFGGSTRLRAELAGALLLLRHWPARSLIEPVPGDLATLPPGHGYLSANGSELRPVRVAPPGQTTR